MNEPAPLLLPEFLRPHAKLVRRLAQRLARDDDEAAELVQLTALAAWRRPGGPPDTPGGWLAAVIANFARLLHRQDSRRERHERRAARPEATSSAADVVERIELHQHVVQSVLDLDEPYRSVLLLRFFEGLSHAQVAARMDVPVETVRTRQKKALARLRRRLRPGAAILGGMLWMTGKTKAAVAALLVLGAGVWWWSRPVAEKPDGDPPPVVAQAVMEVDAAPPAPAVERVAQPDVSLPSPSGEPVAPGGPGPGLLANVVGEVVDVSGRAQADVEVSLYHSPPDRNGERLLARQTTGADGRFEFPATFFPGRRPGGALVCQKDGLGLGGASVDPTQDLPYRIVLRMPTTLQGRVVDPVGAPIEDASVGVELFWSEAWSLPIPDPFRDRVRTHTDRDGRFQLKGLPVRERAGVHVRRDEFTSNFRMVTLADRAVTGPEEFVLRPASRIEGAVIDAATGEGLPGLRVVAQGANEHLDFTNAWHETVTDADGDYVLSGMAEGVWNVMLDLDDAQARRGTAPARRGVALAASEVLTGQDLEVSGGALLEIRCVDANRGAGLEGVHVGVYSAYRPRSGAAVQGVLTDATGAVSLRVPPGEVHAYLMGDVEGYLAQYAGSHDLIAEDGETYELSFELTPAVTLQGVVVDPAGLPVEGAVVQQAGGFAMRMPSSGPSARTDASGHFTLSGFVPGRAWQVTARAEGLGLREPVLVLEEEADRDLRLVLEQRPEVILRGRVVDQDGEAVAEAILEVHPEPLSVEPMSVMGNGPRTASDGTFEVRDLWPGMYRVSAVWNRPGTWTFEPSSTESVEVVEGVVVIDDLLLRR